MSLRLDNIDVQIIELLQKDGRMMFKDVASKVGVSPPTVRSRLKRFEELGLIKKFMLVLDSEKIWGMTRVFVAAKLAEVGIEELKEKLSQLDEVRGAYLTAGEKELVLEIELDDLQKLGELLSKLASQAGLSDFSSFVVSKVLKEEYGTSIKPNTFLQFKCDFCGALIYGKPIIEYISGGRYYFSGQECAKAYKERVTSRKNE